jgi:hypothetical protein
MGKYLKKLTLSHYHPNEKYSTLDETRLKLVQALDRQAQHCEALLNDGVFLDMVRSWLRCEDEAMCLPADRFYWQHRTGCWMITLRVDEHVLSITDDKVSVEVGYAEDIPNVLETLKMAVKAGELDEKLSAMYDA